MKLRLLTFAVLVTATAAHAVERPLVLESPVPPPAMGLPQPTDKMMRRALDKCAAAGRVCRNKPGAGIVMEPK